MTELYRVASICLAILVVLLFAASAVPASGGRILCYTMWDDRYLYCGFVIDDTNIVGSNNRPNSKPWEDDDIEVLLDPKLERAATPTPNTVRMAISAAGGSSFAVGKDGTVYTLSRITESGRTRTDLISIRGPFKSR